MANDQLLSHSIDAENSVIGGILTGRVEEMAIAGQLHENFFYSGLNRKIYSTAMDIVKAGGTPDIITIFERMKDSGDTQIKLYVLSELTDLHIGPAYMASHVTTIIEMYKRRTIYELGHKIIQMTGDRAVASEVVEEIMNVVESLHRSDSEGFVHLAEAADDVMDLLTWRYDNPNKPIGQSSGFIDWDRHTGGFKGGDMHLLGARPSQGKTALALDVAKNFGYAKKASGVVSCEMPVEQLFMRALFNQARVDSSLMNYGQFQPEDFRRLTTDALTVINELPIYVKEAGSETASAILAEARMLRRQKNIELLVVDYVQLLNEDGNASRNLEIGKISRGLKMFAIKEKIPVLALSQLGRQAEGRQGQLSDLRDSGTLEQDADVVSFLFRPETVSDIGADGESNDGKAELRIAKNRNGTTGDITLRFSKQYTRFDNYISDSNAPSF